MARLKGMTLILISICIMQHFLQAHAQKKHGSSLKPTTSPRNSKKSGSKDPRHDAALFQGRTADKEGMRCTWTATESGAEPDGTFDLSIGCKNGTGTSLRCEYSAKPELCPEYASDIEAFWKQLGRSIRRQKALCRDPKALLKAKMCRKAPKGAHFALKTAPKHKSAPAEKKKKPCSDLPNRQKLAEEYCSSSWSSFCTFFFAMVETDEC